MIECNIPKKYIGESERTLKDKISEHIGYIIKWKVDKTTGRHFNQPGHSFANMTRTILGKVNAGEGGQILGQYKINFPLYLAKNVKAKW